MRVAIVGAGITGAVLARAFAEQGYSVHIYEALPHLGGLAQQHVGRCRLRSPAAIAFFNRITTFHEYDLFTWNAWCSEVLFHPEIHLVRSTPVTHLDLFCECYGGGLMYNTARPDVLLDYKFGELPVHDDFPTRMPDTVALSVLYIEYLARKGVRSLGMSGTYMHLSIDECVSAALTEVDRQCIDLGKKG